MADQSVKRKRLSEVLEQNNGEESFRRGQMVGLSTLVDIVFIIDATGSMQNLLDAVKEQALTMYKQIVDGLREKRRIVDKLRIKTIFYRDIYVDTDAFVTSEFFTLPEQSGEFKSFVEKVKATGGGDEPESGLEALHMALQTDFQDNKSVMKKGRHILVLMTDASAHKLNDPQRAVDPQHVYPSDMPESIAALQDEWQGLDSMTKRMIVFAPNMYPWTVVGRWAGVNYVVSEAGKGISKDVYDQVMAIIIGSC